MTENNSDEEPNDSKRTGRGTENCMFIITDKARDNLGENTVNSDPDDSTVGVVSKQRHTMSMEKTYEGVTEFIKTGNERGRVLIEKGC